MRPLALAAVVAAALVVPNCAVDDTLRAQGYLVSLSNAFDVLTPAEVSAITSAELLQGAGERPYQNPGFGLMQANSDGNYELAFYFDTDGDINAVYLLQRTYLQSDVQVCLQFMPFDYVAVGDPGNTFGGTYGVPLITNPMFFDQLDCTFGQGPKYAHGGGSHDGDAAATTSVSAAAVAAAAVASAAAVLVSA